MQKNWNKATSNIERYRYYEGKDAGKNTPFYSSVNLNAMSDRQEAELLLAYVLAKYTVFTPIKRSDTREIEEIEAFKATMR